MDCLSEDAVRHTTDGFWAATSSLSDILAKKGVTTFLSDQNQERDCDKFFDDWYLYAIPGEGGYVYSLFKMREQEHDAESGLIVSKPEVLDQVAAQIVNNMKKD